MSVSPFLSRRSRGVDLNFEDDDEEVDTGLGALNFSAFFLFIFEALSVHYMGFRASLPITMPQYSIVAGHVVKKEIEFWGPSLSSIVIFYLVSPALLHLLAAIFNARYEAQLRLNYNVFRFLEYAISASVMIILVAMTLGLSDGVPLLNLGIAMFSVCIFGLISEKHNSKLAFFFAWVTFAITWAILWILFYRLEVKTPLQSHMQYHFPSLFCLFLSFGLIRLCHFVGWITNFRTLETLFTLSSFVSKSLLTWLVVVSLQFSSAEAKY